MLEFMTAPCNLAAAKLGRRNFHPHSARRLPRKLSQHGRRKKRKEKSEMAPSLSLFRHNQVDHRGQRSDFALNEDRKILSEKASTSAIRPDREVANYVH